MALMKRSNLKGKGPSHKSKSFKKKHNSELKTRSTLTKVKPKRKLTDAVMMVTEEGSSAQKSKKPQQKGLKMKRGQVAPKRKPQSKAQRQPIKVQQPKQASAEDDDFEDMVLEDVPVDDMAEGGDAGEPDSVSAAAVAAAATAAAKKKAKKKKALKQPAAQFAATRDTAATIAEATPAAQADWLWESYAAHSGASLLERGNFGGTHMVQLGREGNLEQCLKAVEPRWQSDFCNVQNQANGSPTLLLVGPSAAGANDLIKQLPTFNRAVKVGKLFAKHFKVGEQEEALAKAPLAVAVGTPNRIGKLADLGALRLDRLKYLLVDVHLDAKQRTILDQPETRTDFWDFFKKHWGPRMAAGNMKVGLFSSQKLPR